MASPTRRSYSKFNGLLIYDLLHNKLYHVANDVIEIISRIVLNNTLMKEDCSFLSPKFNIEVRKNR